MWCRMGAHGDEKRARGGGGVCGLCVRFSARSSISMHISIIKDGLREEYDVGVLDELPDAFSGALQNDMRNHDLTTHCLYAGAGN